MIPALSFFVSCKDGSPNSPRFEFHPQAAFDSPESLMIRSWPSDLVVRTEVAPADSAIARAPLRALGASSLTGEVSVTQNLAHQTMDLVVDVEGAVMGRYEVQVSEEPCPSPPPDASRAKIFRAMTRIPTGSDTTLVSVGWIDVDQKGRGHFEASIGGLYGDTTQILLKEMPGTNLPLGDEYGNVACGPIMILNFSASG
jgi:hypothetical protein